MNNPLNQKYQYYLNESHRLNKELKNEIEYSKILESLLFEFLDEENLNILEHVLQGNVAYTGQGISRLSFEGGPEQGRQIKKRLNTLVDLARYHANRAGSDPIHADKAERAIQALKAKGFVHQSGKDVTVKSVLSGTDHLVIPNPVLQPDSSHVSGIGSDIRSRVKADKEQKRLSKKRRDAIRDKTIEDRTKRMAGDVPNLDQGMLAVERDANVFRRG